MEGVGGKKAGFNTIQQRIVENNASQVLIFKNDKHNVIYFNYLFLFSAVSAHLEW